MWSFFCSFTIKAFPLSVAVLRILALCKLIVTSQHQQHQEHIASTTFGPPPPPLLLPTQNIKNILQQAHTVDVTCWKYSGTKVFLPYFLISKEKKKSRVGLQYIGSPFHLARKLRQRSRMSQRFSIFNIQNCAAAAGKRSWADFFTTRFIFCALHTNLSSQETSLCFLLKWLSDFLLIRGFIRFIRQCSPLNITVSKKTLTLVEGI